MTITRDMIADAGFTVLGLARKAGMSKSTIHAWLSGKREPHGTPGLAVYDALGFRLMPGGHRPTRLRVVLASRFGSSELAALMREHEPAVNRALHGHRDPRIGWWLKAARAGGTEIQLPHDSSRKKSLASPSKPRPNRPA
jgi:transcriptional regulator with XRE-family HTH domain